MEIAIALHENECLAVDDSVGCTADVRRGQVWITTEGRVEDVIASAGERGTLSRASGIVVNALRTATVVVRASRRVRDVTFRVSRSSAGNVVLVTRILLWRRVKRALRPVGSILIRLARRHGYICRRTVP